MDTWYHVIPYAASPPNLLASPYFLVLNEKFRGVYRISNIQIASI